MLTQPFKQSTETERGWRERERELSCKLVAKQTKAWDPRKLRGNKKAFPSSTAVSTPTPGLAIPTVVLRHPPESVQNEWAAGHVSGSLILLANAAFHNLDAVSRRVSVGRCLIFSLPGKPAADDSGPLSTICGLLCGIVACCLGFLVSRYFHSARKLTEDCVQPRYAEYDNKYLRFIKNFCGHNHKNGGTSVLAKSGGLETVVCWVISHRGVGRPFQQQPSSPQGSSF